MAISTKVNAHPIEQEAMSDLLGKLLGKVNALIDETQRTIDGLAQPGNNSRALSEVVQVLHRDDYQTAIFDFQERLTEAWAWFDDRTFQHETGIPEMLEGLAERVVKLREQMLVLYP